MPSIGPVSLDRLLCLAAWQSGYSQRLGRHPFFLSLYSFCSRSPANSVTSSHWTRDSVSALVQACHKTAVNKDLYMGVWLKSLNDRITWSYRKHNWIAPRCSLLPSFQNAWLTSGEFTRTSKGRRRRGPRQREEVPASVFEFFDISEIRRPPVSRGDYRLQERDRAALAHL